MKPKLYLAYAAVTVGVQIRGNLAQMDTRMLTKVLWSPTEDLAYAGMYKHALEQFPLHKQLLVEVIEQSPRQLGIDWLHWQRVRVKWFFKSLPKKLKSLLRVQRLEEHTAAAAYGEAAQG